MMLSMASLTISLMAFACAVMGAFLGVASSQATSRWDWLATITGYAATSGAFGGLLAYAATLFFPGFWGTRVGVADLLAPVLAVGLVALIGWGAALRRQRRLSAVARRLDSTARAIWSTVADDVAHWHTEQGTEDWVRRHFEAVENALARHQGDAALANVRHATVRLAIALRPVTRANPNAGHLADALTATLAIRDQAITTVSAHKIDINSL